MDTQIKNTLLYKKVISDTNIYNAIYSLESYIFEKGLLSEDDIVLYNNLLDKYNFDFIDGIIKQCQAKLETILLNNDELLDIVVYFKIKKNDPVNGIEYRPIHTADLITQICIVSLLNLIMFEDDGLINKEEEEQNTDNIQHKYKRNLSDISKLIPSNFYGNIPSTNVDYLFLNWKTKYQEYSSNVIGKYKEYRSNKKYKYEVCLDLKQFFPSINPNYIYAFVIEKLRPTYSDLELVCLKQVLKKLLFFNVKNIEPWVENYYPEEMHERVKKSKLFFNVGIPQGLPQAYFFGNLCMIEISKVTLEKFSGDQYYYVDDSVIYTNKTSKENFIQDIDSINEEIIKRMNKLINTEAIHLEKEINKFHNLSDYHVKIYSDSKSTLADLSNHKYGLGELSLIAQPTSGINLIINSTIDDLEDANQRNKIYSILKLLKKEIKTTKGAIDKKEDVENSELSKNYLKLLSRYNKFYKFRYSLLDFRDNEISRKKMFDFFKKFMKKSEINTDNLSIEQYVYKSKIDLKKFFEIFDGDLFQVESNLYIKYLERNSKYLNDFINAIITLEKKITTINDEKKKNSLYFSKDIQSQYVFKKIQSTKYNSLPLLVGNFIQPCSKISTNKELEILGDLDSKLKEEDYINSFFLENSEINAKIRFVYFTSEEFKRKLLNTIFSHIINVNANDDYCFVKNNNRTLLYFELRILTQLRNRAFSSIDFKIQLEKILTDAYNDIACERIDNRIIEVIPHFIRHVKSSQFIDDLIMIHRIVNSFWKNGSRFLHFYTLHDEEHSIELIKFSTKIVQTIEYLKLKDFDYYILYLACYLHDISMVIHPNLDLFFDDSVSSNLAWSAWKKEFYSEESITKDIEKKAMLDSFIKVSTYFETLIRSKHSKDSARFIKTKDAFHFINRSVIQHVADVGEAHGYDSSEVYGLHSRAKEDVISLKYLMIILRFADLIDISKDRISQNILKENIEHMDKESKFHWISHLITDDCNLKANFELKKKVLKSGDSFITPHAITEKIELDINLNTKNLTKVSGEKCNNCSALFTSKNQIQISIKTDDSPCEQSDCNFLCRCVRIKHDYLFGELMELQKYLDVVNQGLFKTEFYININYKNGNKLSPNYTEVILNKIHESY